jgi:MtrB/PioB family decaheme-associated outer membrane protein
MDKKAISALIAALFASSPAFAQYDEGWKVEGGAALGPIWRDISDNKGDTSKFEEYRDLGNGVLSNVFVRGRGGRTWFEGYGENFGRDDQFLMLRGGMYDLFKYKVYSDSLRHNFLSDGRTPFAGAGSDFLSATFPQPDPSTWNPVNIGYKRTDNGGFFEWQGFAPWYIRAEVQQLKFDGSKIGSGANGTSPGNGFTDLVFPVQYDTKNAMVEGGYNTGKMNIAVSYLYSKFENDFETLRWNNPFFANGVDTTYLPPDNTYQRVEARATFRDLPWRSTLAARYTWSQSKSDADLATQALNGTGTSAFVPTNPNTSSFDGKVRNNIFTLTLASVPAKNLDTRIYYNYYKRENQSNEVIYNAPSGLDCGSPCVNDRFNYTRNNFGLDAYWRFMPNNRLGAGYEYQHTDQNRHDYDNVRINRFFVEWKNTAVAGLSARLKYTYLQRRSDYLLGNEGTDANDAAFLERFTSAFDSSDLDRNELKFMGDWSPMPLLDFSLEAIWKDNKYKNITLGRTKDEREEVYVSGSYGDPNKVRFTAFADFEHIKYDSNHRNVGVGSCDSSTGPNCFDPGTLPNSKAFNWSARNKDRNWVLGVGVDWPVNPKLMVKASALYYDTDGSADITSQNNFGNPLPIHAYDDSKHTSLNLKGIWQYDRNWSFTLGYAYERWRYNDAGYDGYQYTIPFPGVTNNTSQSYLNGYYAFTNYTANIVYLLAGYRFDTGFR